MVILYSGPPRFDVKAPHVEVLEKNCFRCMESEQAGAR